MADSFAYRVRTKEGRILEGKMEADGEGAVATRLRGQGMVPIQITKDAKVSMKMELNILPKRVKLKDLAIFSRQFATMINSGLSLHEDAEHPRRADGESQARRGHHRSSRRRGEGFEPFCIDVEAPEGLQQAVHLDGEGRRDRWAARHRPEQGGGRTRGRLQAAPEGQVCDDVPDRRRRDRRRFDSRHAASSSSRRSPGCSTGWAGHFPSRRRSS